MRESGSDVRLRIRVLALAAGLALVGGLTACGGDDGDGGAGDEASFDAGPAKITKPGAVVALGERVFVEYAGLGPNNEPTVNTTLGVIVHEVSEGDASEIEDFGEDRVPYYVHAEYENHGDQVIHAGAGPGGRFTIRGADGKIYEKAGVISIGGEFEACPAVDSTATLAPEEAVADCVVIDMAAGVASEEVLFQGDYAAGEEPVGWAVE